MSQSRLKRLDSSNLVRDRLFAGDRGAFGRYRDLVVGDGSLWSLVRFELITTFVVPLPGALGIALRRIFCPALFGSVGRKPIFGRNIVIRNGAGIRLGDNVVIDDGCLVDARGAGPEGVAIGDGVILNRDAIVIAKSGSIRIGSGTDIGARAQVTSQGGVEIGESVSVAGGSKIGGGLLEPRADGPSDDGGQPAATNGSRGPSLSSAKGYDRFTRGPIRIGDRTTLFPNVLVLDGVEIGEQALIGAGSVVTNDVPAASTYAPRQRGIVLSHGQTAAAAEEAAPISARPPERQTDGGALDIVYDAVAELNETLSADHRLALSPDTRLVGGDLASIDLVNFVVAAEDRLEKLGVRVDLAAASTLDPSPLQTLGTLAAYVDELTP
ncbi:MAG: hypothetical protein MJB57_02795 [Gemmatimonadetes bacterium]|nr:hypothetical protein [Gemmatimonadota bacterium]